MSEYFRIIQSSEAAEGDARRVQEEKINNYLKYGEPWSNKEMPSMLLPITYKKTVKSQSIATASRLHAFVITTQLCCEDEYDI